MQWNVQQAYRPINTCHPRGHHERALRSHLEPNRGEHRHPTRCCRHWRLLHAGVRDSEIRARYVELAIGVLRESPSNKSQTPNIRAWAVKVIEELSPIKLSPDAQEELKKQPLPGNDFFRRHNVGATMTPPVERR